METTEIDKINVIERVDEPLSPGRSEEPTHDPYRRVTDMLQRLAPGKMKVGFLIGAGCPYSIRIPDAGTEKPLIPNIVGLTASVRMHLADAPPLRDMAELLWTRMQARGISQPTVEDALSHIRTLQSLCGTSGIDGFTASSLRDLDLAICKHIRTAISKKLPSFHTSYHSLATWIHAIARDKPVEIFTTNYDLLLEQALEEQNVPYFDGFIGGDNAFLDIKSILDDDLPSRWARLWKIHGSINWWLTDDNRLRRRRDEVEGEQLLIYPSHLKYDQSRQMPYYAMFDRLRTFLRYGQCVLITCGYSFGDEHINACIEQGLAGNPNAACLGMIYGCGKTVPLAMSMARRNANLTVLAADRGVVGAVDRPWSTTVKDVYPIWKVAVSSERVDGGEDEVGNCRKWLLGDFTALGEFLLQQLESKSVGSGDNV